MSLSYAGLVVTSEGKLKVFGNNSYGQLGNGNTSHVLNALQVDVETTSIGVKQVAAGYYHSVVLMNDGKAKSSGFNGQGQLGLGNTVDQSTFKDISLVNIKQIACGDYYTMFLMNDGTTKGVGVNNAGQLGNGNKVNQSVIQASSLSGVKEIACGLAHTMFLMQDGKVKAAGENTSGQLAVGDTSNVTGPVSTLLSNVKQVACGDSFSMFLMNDGSVKAVGQNHLGQLGIGNTANPKVSIVTVPITGVKQISCGKDHAMFLMEDGTVKGVGYNNYGQLGVGNTVNQSSPYTLPLTDVVRIATGAFNSYFLMKDGSLKSCGYNAFGAVGDGNTITKIDVVNTLITSGAVAMQEYIKMSLNRFLFQQVDQLKTWLSGSWKNLSGPVTKDLFLAEGVSSLIGIPISNLTNGTKILKWSDENSPSKLVATVPKSLYDATNKLYKGIGVVETQVENVLVKPKTLIVNADHTEATLEYSLDNGLSWYTITSGEVKNISGVAGNQLKIRANLPTATATLTALSYAWA